MQQSFVANATTRIGRSVGGPENGLRLKGKAGLLELEGGSVAKSLRQVSQAG
jgi:hypothetical protein